VSWHEATELTKYGILTKLEATVQKGFAISLGQVPMPPLPKDFGDKVFRRWQKHALWLDPKYHTDSEYWPALFHEEASMASTHHRRTRPSRRLGRTVKDAIKNGRKVAFIQSATETDNVTVTP
jgi:hypothetical protein